MGSQEIKVNFRYLLSGIYCALIHLGLSCACIYSMAIKYRKKSNHKKEDE